MKLPLEALVTVQEDGKSLLNHVFEVSFKMAALNYLNWLLLFKWPDSIQPGLNLLKYLFFFNSQKIYETN